MTIPLSINNLDPDSHFYNNVRICNDECEYLNEQTFREKGEVMGITDSNFSMIHLNIRSNHSGMHSILLLFRRHG